MIHPPHLSPTELQSYRDEGFILVRGLLSAEEAAFYRGELHAIADRQGSNDATWSSVKGAGTRITHCHDAPEEKGCVRAYPGTHKLGPLPAVGQDHHLPEENYPIAGATPLPAN